MIDGIWLFCLWIQESRDFYLCFLRKVWIYRKRHFAHWESENLLISGKIHVTTHGPPQPLSVKLKKSITPLYLFYTSFFMSFFFFGLIVHVHMVYLYKADLFITGITVDHHLPYLHGFSLKAHMFKCFGSSRISSSSPYPSQETEQKYEKEEVPSYCRYHISPATPLQ